MLGVPIVVLYLLVLAAVLWFVLEHTPVGRYLFAVGGNAEAARLAGVRRERLVWRFADRLGDDRRLRRA